jgi:hypothetical protein
LSSIIRSRRLAVACRIAALTCVSVFAAAGAASAANSVATYFAACSAQSLSTPFSQWGDTSSYFLLPGGSFEGTADQVGWSLSGGASLTAGNEPFYVNSANDSQSLTVPAGGTATSPYFCVDNTMPDLRLFALQATGGSDLQVTALVQTSNGVRTVSLADLADGSMSSWAPTEPIAGNTASLPDGTTLSVALQFSAPGASGSWQIDDVYVDPYRSG